MNPPPPPVDLLLEATTAFCGPRVLAARDSRFLDEPGHARSGRSSQSHHGTVFEGRRWPSQSAFAVRTIITKASSKNTINNNEKSPAAPKLRPPTCGGPMTSMQMCPGIHPSIHPSIRPCHPTLSSSTHVLPVVWERVGEVTTMSRSQRVLCPSVPPVSKSVFRT